MLLRKRLIDVLRRGLPPLPAPRLVGDFKLWPARFAWSVHWATRLANARCSREASLRWNNYRQMKSQVHKNQQTLVLHAKPVSRLFVPDGAAVHASTNLCRQTKPQTVLSSSRSLNCFALSLRGLQRVFLLPPLVFFVSLDGLCEIVVGLL